MLSRVKTLLSGGLFAAAVSAALLPAAPARAQEAATCIANVTFDGEVSRSYGRAENRAIWGATSGGAVNLRNERWTFGLATIDLFVEVARQSERRCLEDLALRVTSADGFAEAPRGYHYVGHWRADGDGAVAGGVHRQHATVWLYAKRADRKARMVLGDVLVWASSDTREALERRTRSVREDGWALKGTWDAYETAIGTYYSQRGLGYCGSSEDSMARKGCLGHWTTGLFARQVANAAGRDPSETVAALSGRWLKRGECANCGQLVKTFSVGVTDETAVEKTREVSEMVGAAFTSTADLIGAEFAMEITGERTSSQGESVVNSLQQSSEEEIEYTCPRGAIWQWVTQVEWGDGRRTQANSDLMACTVAGDEPADPSDISWQGCDAEQVAADLADGGRIAKNDRLAARVGVDAGWRCKTGG